MNRGQRKYVEGLRAEIAGVSAARQLGAQMARNSVISYLTNDNGGFWADLPHAREWPRGTFRPVLRYRHCNG